MIYFVIDANIARSCGNPTENKGAADCYRFLTAVSATNSETGAVADPELRREWIKHANKTFLSWLARMESRRRVRLVETRRSSDYRSALRAIENDGIRTAMDKDVHLVELALFGQHPVASCDDRQRRYVRELSDAYPPLGDIQWVNPMTHEGWAEWLARGCERGSFAILADV